MVFKKYIKRKVNGELKRFGPYYYENYRDKNGKVCTRYLGPVAPKKVTDQTQAKKREEILKQRVEKIKEKNVSVPLVEFQVKKQEKLYPTKDLVYKVAVILFGLSLLVFIILLLIAPTGKVGLEIEDKVYEPGQQIKGNMNLVLNHGEFIPEDAKLVIDNSGEKSEYLLKDLIMEQSTEGQFYIKDSSISGYGKGFGYTGLKKSYPEVSFELRISNKKSIQEEIENISEKDNLTNEIVIIENKTIELYENSDITSNFLENVYSLFFSITGKAITETETGIISSVTAENPFVYELKQGEIAEIVSSSYPVELLQERNIITVTTKYFEEEQGFGEDYVNDKIIRYKIDLSELNIIAKQGQFKVSLFYQDKEFISSSKEISVSDPEIAEGLKINTNQLDAEINRPVEWEKEITLEKSGKINIEIPKQAKNIKAFVKDSEIPIEINEKQAIKEAIISEGELEYTLEYETPSPNISEIQIDRGKIIEISSEIQYQNVTAYTELPFEVENQGSVTLYRVVDETKEQVDFEINDINNNSLYDYVEWVVPSLINETYELVIEITSAQHLDENRIFISDIYGQLKELDDLWSEKIKDNEYVRITFRIPLDNTRDITIFPRIISVDPKIQVYEKDKEDLIAEFTNIISNEYNKVYLTNLPDEYSQDTFDLKIINGEIEFDQIIDPSLNVFFDNFNDGVSWTYWTETNGTGWVLSNTACGHPAGVYGGSGYSACAENSASNTLSMTNLINLTKYTDCILTYVTLVDSSFDLGEFYFVNVTNSAGNWVNIYFVQE